MELSRDWWISSIAADVYSCFVCMEDKLPRWRDFPLKPGMRRHYIDFLMTWCDRFHLNTIAKHLAVLLLDMVFDSYDVSVDNACLICAGCLLLAAKFETREVEVPHISEVVEHCLNKKFTSRDCMRMELVLLEFFHWNISYPTAAHYADYFRTLSLVCRNRNKESQVCAETLQLFDKYIAYFLEISAQDYSYRSYRPSVVSAACVASARQCVHLRPTWPAHVQRVSGLREKDFNAAMGAMLRTAGETKRVQQSRQSAVVPRPIVSHHHHAPPLSSSLTSSAASAPLLSTTAGVPGGSGGGMPLLSYYLVTANCPGAPAIPIAWPVPMPASRSTTAPSTANMAALVSPATLMIQGGGGGGGGGGGYGGGYNPNPQQQGVACCPQQQRTPLGAQPAGPASLSSAGEGVRCHPHRSLNQGQGYGGGQGHLDMDTTPPSYDEIMIAFEEEERADKSVMHGVLDRHNNLLRHSHFYAGAGGRQAQQGHGHLYAVR